MTEAKKSAIREILEDPSASRLDFLHARTVAYSVAGEMEKLAKFTAEAQENFKTSRSPDARARAALQAGVGLWIMRKYAEACAALEAAAERPDGAFLVGLCKTELGACDEAVRCFDRAEKAGQDAFACAMASAEALRRAGRIDDALAKVRAFQKSHDAEAELHYQKGRCLIARMDYELGTEALERAVELNPQHLGALFHLGFWNDLRGNDEAAVDYYEKAVAIKPTYRNALLNLGLLYEDAGEYEKAATLYDRILAADATDRAARMYHKDATESLAMYYDEATERRQHRTAQMLKTPLSEFELSARAKAVLEQMDVRTLGDLARLDEDDLATSKNLGETSLKELRDLLRSRGLHFGMTADEGERRGALPGGASGDILSKPVADLDLSVRCQKAVQSLKIATVGDLAQRSEKDLLSCPNFGQTSLNEIRRKLQALGLSLKPKE